MLGAVCGSSSGVRVCQQSHVGAEEVSEETLDGRLGGIVGQAQHLGGAGGRRARLSRVETLHGAGQPDQPLQTLDVAPAVVHELVLGHRSAAAARKEEPLSWSSECQQRQQQRLLTDGGETSPLSLLTMAARQDQKQDREPLRGPVEHLHLLQHTHAHTHTRLTGSSCSCV